jgi:hypothetical protein
MKEDQMDQTELAQSLKLLDVVSLYEYRASLSEVAAPTKGGDDQRRLSRIGRLLGVIMKQPFATPQNLDVPSSSSSAHISWELKPETAFRDETTRDSWQYQTLTTFLGDEHVRTSVDRPLQNEYAVAQDAQFERGFFWYLVLACREYLCDDQLRSEINNKVEGAQHADLDTENLTPKAIARPESVAIGALLIQRVPVLSVVDVSVIAGLILIIYRVGLDVFCQWAYQFESNTAETWW